MKGAYMQIFEDDTFVLGGIETEVKHSKVQL